MARKKRTRQNRPKPAIYWDEKYLLKRGDMFDASRERQTGNNQDETGSTIKFITTVVA